ncbi:anaerobic ribonucleoside-triphosphate reductase activating protein [Candidatus Pacearchaeota archaeon]|nr:MAG: anaerobic ribonucleoside-triphosphate reductase activating protein [Candidatus Pacearchaeota archaeon]
MLFGGLQRTTLVDYPGKVAATIFTAGCNFRCPYCHNPELVLPELIKKQPKITEKEILEFLEERQKLLEGVCITGGEPTIQSDLIDFIKKVKDLGFLVKLDTNGSCPNVLNSLIEGKLIDYIAMDIKAPKQKYELFIEDENIVDNIDKSIELLKQDKVDYEFRTTLAPNILEEQDILAIVNWIQFAPRYFLQRFKNNKVLNEKFKNLQPWSEQRIKNILKKIKPYFSKCDIR